jgi:hypothetical protein
MTPLDDVMVNISSGEYSDAAELLVAPDRSFALLKFDLSAVPQLSSAVFEYTTTDTTGDATLHVSLGAHSLWPATNVVAPDPMIQIGTASGLWPTATRLQSDLSRDLLTAEMTTLRLDTGTGDDDLGLISSENAEHGPRLLLTGDSSFCATWQSNIDAQSTEPDPDPTHEPEPETPPTPNATPESNTDSGSVTLWSSLSLLVFGVLRLHRKRSFSKRQRSCASC